MPAGALTIAADGRPEIDPGATLTALDELAERVRLRLDVGDADTHVIDRLQDVLFRESGFRGPIAAEYHDPRASLLDVVVAPPDRPADLARDRRAGGRLADRSRSRRDRVAGPLHHRRAGRCPARSGRRRAAPDARRLPGAPPALDRRAACCSTPGCSGRTRKREILARVLRNLRSAHLAARDWPAALGSVELLAVVEPTDPDHGRDRGLLLGRMGRFNDAVTALGRYLEERPDGHDVDDVRQVMGIFAGRRN